MSTNPLLPQAPNPGRPTLPNGQPVGAGTPMMGPNNQVRQNPGAQMANDTQGGLDRNEDIYNVQNPGMAMRSAMRAAGYNPMGSNPVLKRMQTFAPGLANAFLLRNANSGQTNESMANEGGMGAMFGKFLASVLSGGGGAIQGMLRNPLGGAGNGSEAGPGGYGALMTFERRRQEQDKALGTSEGGGSAQTVNPFIEYLSQLLEADPTAAQNMLTSFYTPMMGATAKPYYDAVGGLAERGRDELVRDPNHPENNALAWLLNRAGTYQGPYTGQ